MKSHPRLVPSLAPRSAVGSQARSQPDVRLWRFLSLKMVSEMKAEVRQSKALGRAANAGSSHAEFVLGLSTQLCSLGFLMQQLFRDIKIIACKE